jgi:hypothetical protein
LEHRDIYGSIILKSVLRVALKLWTGCSVQQGEFPCECGNENSIFTKGGEFYEYLRDYQFVKKELYSLELIS